MSTDPGGPFKVGMSGLTEQQLRTLVQKAKAKGLGGPMLDAAARIVARLERDPLTAGEAQYDLEPPKITMCLIVDIPLAVHYGVLVERRTVVLQQFRST